MKKHKNEDMDEDGDSGLGWVPRGRLGLRACMRSFSWIVLSRELKGETKLKPVCVPAVRVLLEWKLRWRQI